MNKTVKKERKFSQNEESSLSHMAISSTDLAQSHGTAFGIFFGSITLINLFSDFELFFGPSTISRNVHLTYQNWFREMTKIMISSQSHKSCRNYKSENGRTRISEYIRSGIRFHGGVSIPADRSHPLWALFPRLINDTTRSQDQCVKNGLKIGMKHIRQHLSQRKIGWANKIAVTTIKFAESCL
jgi:hypothetical protein